MVTWLHTNDIHSSVVNNYKLHGKEHENIIPNCVAYYTFHKLYNGFFALFDNVFVLSLVVAFI